MSNKHKRRNYAFMVFTIARLFSILYAQQESRGNMDMRKKIVKSLKMIKKLGFSKQEASRCLEYFSNEFSDPNFLKECLEEAYQ